MTKAMINISKSMFSEIIDTHPRLQAKNIDRLLGYKITKIENKLLQKYRPYDQVEDQSSRKQHFKGTQTWIGLHPQALQTPYSSIYEALDRVGIEQVEHVVDFGAAYGRVGIVLSVINPKARFTGFEIVKQRQLEGNRIFEKLNLKNSYIEEQNILSSDFLLPDADVYFIYDFSREDDICQVLFDLSLKERKKIYLIVRGDRCERLMKKKFKNYWIFFSEVDSGELKIYTKK